VEGRLVVALVGRNNTDAQITQRPRAAVGVTRMSLLDALAPGPSAWDALLVRAESPSPFMSWAWHRAWADSAPPSELDASEVLALHGADGSLHALLPIRLCRIRFRRVWVRALIWAVGDIGCPDELDVPAVPDADWSALAAALDALPWQVIILSNLAEEAPNAERLCAALAARGHATRRRPLWSCPQLELPGSWDAYLAALSPNRRQILRRKERSLFRDHAATVVVYEEDRLDEGWGYLLRLHERRWDDAGGGAFRDPRSERLQRQFAGEMAKRKRLWLSTLDLDGQPAAAWYGFASDDTVYFYQGGRDPRWERESVGLVLMGMMIRRAIERGYRAFNFLRGDDQYKQHWTSARRETIETIVFRSGWRSLWLRALDAAAAFRQEVPVDR
jgi:CelD/BcsL family acetyltransferase involved in cellulose biosynthesis